MDFDAALRGFQIMLADYGPLLDTWLLAFCRVLAFLFVGPIFNRKDIAFNIKLAFALFLTSTLIWLIPVNAPAIAPNTGQLILLVFMNIMVGATIGFIADMIIRTVMAAGSLMNNQIGLSSAVIFDPSSRQQVMVLDRLFGMLVTVVFIHLGGIYWMINALQRSFETFPVHSAWVPLVDAIDLEYLVTVSANVVVVATQLVAPVIVVTLAVDVILGIVNRTAQQMPVFQLSFALKPAIGVAVMLATLPIFLNVLMNFLTDYAPIF